jgi:regulator of RNase E activity RraA
MLFDQAAFEELARIGTATLSTLLVERGIRRHRIRGASPLFPDRRSAGPAFTLRFLPGREDLPLAPSLVAPGGLIEAVESAPPGSVLVIETGGDREGGVLGDFLADRLRLRGVAGAVSDGVMRDRVGLERVGLPIWCAGTVAAPAFASLWCAGSGGPVAVGGLVLEAGAKLAGADLRGADLRGLDLAGADLSGAQLQGANLEAASLRRANLRGARLDGANLRWADLSHAACEGASFRQADLSEAALAGTAFTRANLAGAMLEGAVGPGVNFEYADLARADFTGALITPALIERGKLAGTVLPDGSVRG